ncbi:membrane metallo-endopeptidase-like 1 isoform X1 [Lasioglossum baleicum]|uniref:membrane metallo-endopeptidase-like 1 isoform X1 n=2 Tax=Lasioglossum baleicum TaxID=434251 RepID=UPI003FCDC584
MLFLWLISHLTIVTSLPTGLPVTRIWRILEDTVNDTETLLDHDYHEKQEQRVCETVYCNQIAKKILESMDTSADPCEDFYQYTCGSWNKHNHIPDNEVEWSEDQVIMEKTYKRLKDILEEPDRPSDIIPVKMARKLYRSCMNVDAIERRGIKPIQDILDSTGGWPMAMPLKAWDSHKFPWQRIDKHYVTLIGNSAFYNIEYEVDQNNTHQYVLTLDQEAEYPLSTKRDLSKIFNDNDTYAVGIYRIIETFAQNKGYHVHQHQLINDVAKMVAFEIDLLNIFEEDKESHASTENYERMTLGELQKWYSSSGVTAPTAKINFLEMMQHVFKWANISIDASEPIVVYNPVFLYKLARLLGNTSQRVIVNYIQWNMVNKFLSFTTQEMRNITFNMTYSSYNISNYMRRWEVCVLNMHMKDAVSYMFVKKYVSDDVVDKAKEMVQRIKEELNNRIQHSHWLSDTVKTALARKLHLINTQVGYPEWYKDDEAVIQFYEGLKIGADYFQNLLNCAAHELIRGLKEFRGVVSRTDWLDYPITVNAFYTQTINAIIIPAAELQEPYFTPLLPDAINYAATGFVIGHELSHSFDSEGIKFDANGYKSGWISRNIMDKYEDRATCFVYQFGNYTLDVLDEHGDNVQLDGKLTEDENLADAVGAQVAFSAYHKIAHQKHQMKLPGLEHFTDDQLFFLEFANAWCAHVRPEYEADAVNSDEHSPPKYRVVGSLSNMAAFSEAFQCPQDSPMNPRHKCTLWN